jgi:hypothetical protein
MSTNLQDYCARTFSIDEQFLIGRALCGKRSGKE